MKNVTLNEYKEIVSQYWKGEVTSEELDQYEIVLENAPNHKNEFINKLVVAHCNDVREESDRLVYVGISKYLDTNELENNGFAYVSSWSDGYRQVYISEQDYAIVTACEGDLSINLTDSKESYNAEIERAEQFYSEY